MRRLFSVLLLSSCFSLFASATATHARLIRVKANHHHVTHHHAHKATKHHAHKVAKHHGA